VAVNVKVELKASLTLKFFLRKLRKVLKMKLIENSAEFGVNLCAMVTFMLETVDSNDASKVTSIY